MVREALLSRVPIPAINIHPIPTQESVLTRQRLLWARTQNLLRRRVPRSGSAAVRCNSSRTRTGWAYSLAVPGQCGACGTRQMGRRRRRRQARSARYSDLSGAREQPAHGLFGRGAKETSDLRAASPRRQQTAGSTSAADRRTDVFSGSGSSGSRSVTKMEQRDIRLGQCQPTPPPRR